MRTCNLPIANPALYHTATSAPLATSALKRTDGADKLFSDQIKKSTNCIDGSGKRMSLDCAQLSFHDTVGTCTVTL